MRNYYVIFDDDQKRVGMSPQVGSDVAEIQYDDYNTQDLNLINIPLFWWLGLIWNLILIILVLWLLNYCITKAFQTSDDDDDNDDDDDDC